MVGDEVGELEDMRFINTKLALEIGSREGILGIKARMDRVGPNVATEPLKLAVQVGRELGKPTMVHIGREERMRAPLSAILDVMQPGDIISTGLVESPADSVDDIIAEIAAARVTERGSRADDRTSEAAMEDRKKAGYF